MNYNKLQSILPNHEIHYISDSTQFFIDNQIKSKQFKNNTFILFNYTLMKNLLNIIIKSLLTSLISLFIFSFILLMNHLI